MHFECPDCRNDHRSRWLEVRFSAFYVKEFFSAQFRPKTSLSDHIVSKPQRGFGRNYRVATVRYVGERAAVNHRGIIFKRLNEIWFERVFEQRGHRAIGFKVARMHRLTLEILPDNDFTEV